MGQTSYPTCAICMAWLLLRSHILAVLSQDAVKTLLPSCWKRHTINGLKSYSIWWYDGLLTLGMTLLSRLTSLQHASNTGPVCICWALGTVCPLSCTSQQRTWHQRIGDHSQRLPAIADIHVTNSSWTTYVIGPRSSNKKVPWQGRRTESQTTDAVIRRGSHLNILSHQTTIILD